MTRTGEHEWGGRQSQPISALKKIVGASAISHRPARRENLRALGICASAGFSASDASLNDVAWHSDGEGGAGVIGSAEQSGSQNSHRTFGSVV